MKKIKEKIYNGDVIVTADNQKMWEEKLKDVTKITGYIRAEQGATITIPSPVLAQTGDIRAEQGATITIPSPVLAQTGGIKIEGNEGLEKQLWKTCKKSMWYITEKSSDFIIKANPQNASYKLNNVAFSREWFLKIKNNKLSPDKIFAIDNVEHRRIAYEFMDKVKMKSLKDYKILDDVTDDGYGYPMKIVSFTVQNMKEPLLFCNCHCPSTGREYFIGTNQITCRNFKSQSFGLPLNTTFSIEW